MNSASNRRLVSEPVRHMRIISIDVAIDRKKLSIGVAAMYIDHDIGGHPFVPQTLYIYRALMVTELSVAYVRNVRNVRCIHESSFALTILTMNH